MWLPLPKGWNADYLVALLEQQNILTLPSRVFAVDKNNFPQAIRMTLGGSKTHEDIRKSCEIIKKILSGPNPSLSFYS